MFDGEPERIPLAEPHERDVLAGIDDIADFARSAHSDRSLAVGHCPFFAIAGQRGGPSPEECQRHSGAFGSRSPTCPEKLQYRLYSE